MATSPVFRSFLLMMLLIGTIFILPSSSNALSAEMKLVRKLRESLLSPPPPPIANHVDAGYDASPNQPKPTSDHN
ncbi:hypothetical protein L484_013278 [Morus notabilis]|uniref:Transmembrane protein n=1 Tax=Morus notabilis TaxID=981085 RepID=W9SC79_9ROSA|nr:hypothetical protein L484_013278 [Morus notabilis]